MGDRSTAQSSPAALPLARAAGVGVRTGALLSVAAGAVVASGQPFLFPSLGPSAYAMAVLAGDDRDVGAGDLLGGHAIGVVAGLLAYHTLAAGTTIASMPDPTSTAGLHLVASGVLAVALTAGGMVATDRRHGPACATTLIVSLGLLPTLVDGLLVMLSVASLLALREGADAVGVW
jgi:hypothetical protein